MIRRGDQKFYLGTTSPNAQLHVYSPGGITCTAKGREKMSTGQVLSDKLEVVTDAIHEVGFTHADDALPVPNRFTDVREVTNLVRFTTYTVDNMAAVITEDIAEGQAAAAILAHATSGLAAAVARLEQIKAK